MKKIITLTVDKTEVYNEVAKTTSYTGYKRMDEDETAYKRIFTTDEDALMLERFWTETCNRATNEFKPFLNSVDNQAKYTVLLELSSSFNEKLKESIETTLFSYFVSSIVSKWFRFTNKDETEVYTGDSILMMQDIMKKIYSHKRPVRRTVAG